MTLAGLAVAQQVPHHAHGARRRACGAARDAPAEKLGWKIGDEVTLESETFRTDAALRYAAELTREGSFDLPLEKTA